MSANCTGRKGSMSANCTRSCACRMDECGRANVTSCDVADLFPSSVSLPVRRVIKCRLSPPLFSETDPVRHPTMTLELVEKKSLAHVRILAPGEEAALRSKKRGDADQEANKTYLTVVKEVRKKLWIRCDCLGETGERPIIGVRKLSKLRSDLYSLANMPDATVRHAKGCVFGPVDGNTRSRLAPPFGVLFDPFGPSDSGTGDIDPDPEPDRLRSFTGLSAGRETLKLRTSLRMLLTAAGLNTHAKVEGFALPREWLEPIETAAQQFYIVEGIPVSELLFTDPGCWSSGEVAQKTERHGDQMAEIPQADRVPLLGRS